MLTEINNRTPQDKITLLGCMMNPFTKELNFIPELKQQAETYLREELSEIPKVKIRKEVVEGDETEPMLPEIELPNQSVETSSDTQSEVSNEAQEAVAKKIKAADTDDWLEDVVCTGESRTNLGLASEAEIQRYLESRVMEKDHDLTILEWWKRNEHVYPRISKIAKKYLSIPASSVSSERVLAYVDKLSIKKDVG